MPEPSESDLLKFAEDDGAAPAPEPDDLEPWTIVIVDDEPEIHRVTELALRGSANPVSCPKWQYLWGSSAWCGGPDGLG